MTRRTRLTFETLEDRCLLTFSPAVSISVGLNPTAVATADFNNDGKLDLATTVGVSVGRVSLRLGDGAGGFGTAQEIPVGRGYPSSIAVADFNGDAKLDIVVASIGEANILMGNGDGTFQPPSDPIGVWFSLLDVGVGDFNGDQNTDILLSQDNGDSFGLFEVGLGDGQGGFVWTWSDYLSYPAAGLAVADLNGDSKLDAVTADLHVLLGNGDGALTENGFWGATSIDPNSRAVTVGDFTGDGVPDLAVAGSGVGIRRGRGDGWFDPAVHHPATGDVQTDVVTGDFDGDGNLDVVTADGDFGTASVLLGNGDGTLRYAGAFATGSSPSSVAVGDFNGDGRPDVAAANAGSHTVSVMLNDGDWNGPLPPPPPPPPLPTPYFTIDAMTVIEGSIGTQAATFTVNLSHASNVDVTVHYETVDSSAAVGSDYTATSGTLTFAPGEISKTFAVQIIGDRVAEPNETLFVNLSNATNAIISDGHGVGTIVDDEPRISISDVTRSEGRKNKMTLFTFTVTLSAAYDQAVTMSYRTVNGTATTGNSDYVSRTGTLTFAPGETTKTITIEVRGDTKKEANETFYLDLFALSGNAMFSKNRGIGTILNDD